MSVSGLWQILVRCGIRGSAPAAAIRQSRPLPPTVPSMASSSTPSSQTPTSNPSSTSDSQTPVQTTTSSSSANPTTQKPSQTTTPPPPRNTTGQAHGPSNLPPVPYNKANSPWKPKQPRQRSKDIEPSKLGALMNRMDRIEEAVEKYVDERGKAALKKSIVPGLDKKEDSTDKA